LLEKSAVIFGWGRLKMDRHFLSGLGFLS
jgi:hypothetical protein